MEDYNEEYVRVYSTCKQSLINIYRAILADAGSDAQRAAFLDALVNASEDFYEESTS